MANNLKYGDLTEKIIGCAMTVHRKMGTGYSELIYSRCFAIELEKAGLKFIKEMEWPVYYEETIVGKRRVDFMVEDKIVVEIKALQEIGNKELAQGLNYLESHKIEIGLLIFDNNITLGHSGKPDKRPHFYHIRQHRMRGA